MSMRNRPFKPEKNIKPVKFTVQDGLSVEAILMAVNSALKFHELEIVFTRPENEILYLTTSTFNGRRGDVVCFLDNMYERRIESPAPIQHPGSTPNFISPEDPMRRPIKKPTPDRELTYEEKVEWFVSNYETGMEFEIMLDSMRDDDLNNFYWCNKKVVFPKMFSEIKKDERV